MKRIPSYLALAAALALTASLAHAQGGATAPATTPATTPAPAKAAPAAAPAKAAPASTHASQPKSTTSSTKTHSSAPMVDINSASKEELMKLPGIGDATADKIIAGRPWKSKSDLQAKGVVNHSTYEKIHSKVVAKQS